MTTRFDDGGDGPDFDSDDPLAVILRPPSDYLAPPPDQYETIRRTASRRRLFRAAAVTGVSLAAAALFALPLHFTASERPTSPTVPLAPPPATSSTASPPSPSASPAPTGTPRTSSPSAPTRAPVSPSARRPAPSATPTAPRSEPSTDRTGAVPTPESSAGR